MPIATDAGTLIVLDSFRRLCWRAAGALVVLAVAACGGGHADGPDAAATAAAARATSAAPPAPPPPPFDAPLKLLAGEAHAWGNRNGPLQQALFNPPSAATSDGEGNIYIAEYSGRSIRRIGSDGIVSTIAGGGTGLDGPAGQALAGGPQGLTRDRAGHLYFVEDCTVRRLSRDGSGDWVVTTIAGRWAVCAAADGPGDQARFHAPAGIAYDPAGYLYVADVGNHAIRRIRLADRMVDTFAGKLGTSGPAPEGAGVPRLDTRFAHPRHVAVDAQRNVFVADTSNFVVQMIRADTQLATTVAGKSGQWGDVDGEGYPGSGQARLGGPSSLAVDALGRVLVADANFHIVRAIVLGSTTVVSTVAGSAVPGYLDGPAAQARFQSVVGVHVLRSGETLIMEAQQGMLRKLSAGAQPTVSTFAGTRAAYGNADGQGAAARFQRPRGVTLTASGEVLVIDRSTQAVVRAVGMQGLVRTLGGGGYGHRDGPLDAAWFNEPWGVVTAPGDVHYVADSGNCVVRRIAASQVSTVAGKPGDCASTDGDAATARLYWPRAIAIGRMGNLLVVDQWSHTLRRIHADGSVQTIVGNTGECGDADGSVSVARLCEPAAVAVAPDGATFVLDKKGLRRVTPGSEGGLHVSTVFSNASLGAGVRGRALTISPTGRLYAAFDDHTIRMLNDSGELSLVAGTPGVETFVPGTLPGVLSAPRGLAARSDGIVFFSTGRGVGMVRSYPACEPGTC
jgi:NHL repeat